jgi:2-dehydropantoate 2-reductase
MGGSIGGTLAREGEAVLFVDKERDHVEAMNQRGLTLTGPVSDFSVSVRAVEPGQLHGRYSTIFLCVKAHHTNGALSQLAPHLTEDGCVVSIQNGLCELEISPVVGPERTVGAFVNFGADYLEPGVVHRGNRGATVVGELDGAVRPRTRRIHSLLRTFEPDALLTSNIFGFLWGKLAYASLLFATAVTDDSIADVLADAEHRELLVALAREAVGAAESQGVTPEAFDGFDPGAFRPEGQMGLAVRSLDELVRFNRKSAKTHSGIWRDLAVRRRKTEVDAQLGWIVKAGGEGGTPTGLTEALMEMIHQIEMGKRLQTRRNLEELGELL